jgi:hypothetical protein
MFPYLKLAAGAAILALGYALAIWTYATPRIDALQAQMAQQHAEDAEATARFLEDRDAKLKEKEDAKVLVESDLLAAKTAYGRTIDALRTRNAGLQHTIETHSADQPQGLPSTAGVAAGPDGRTATLGKLLEQCLAVATDRAADAESLAAQVTGLQSYVKGVCR